MGDSKAMFAMVLLLICIFAGALGQVSWKYSMNNKEQINDFGSLLKLNTVYNIIMDKYIIAGLMLYGLAFLLWLGAMSTLDISFMYPMLSLAYVLTAVSAFVFLGEHISPTRWMGIILIIVGSILITRS